jgi:hypothetical protein
MDAFVFKAWSIIGRYRSKNKGHIVYFLFTERPEMRGKARKTASPLKSEKRKVSNNLETFAIPIT